MQIQGAFEKGKSGLTALQFMEKWQYAVSNQSVISARFNQLDTENEHVCCVLLPFSSKKRIIHCQVFIEVVVTPVILNIVVISLTKTRRGQYVNTWDTRPVNGR